MNLNSSSFISKNFCINNFYSSLVVSSDFLNPDWSQTAEPNAKKRARQNVESRGVSGGGLFSGVVRQF